MAVEQNSSCAEQPGLSPYVSIFAAFSICVGCAIGWGAFVMPATTLLPLSGPLGSSIAMLIGALMILVIACNYHYLINKCRDPGGAFAFARRAFGYDHSFLCGVFLVLTYVTMLWANGTSFAVLARYAFGDFFKFGAHYEIAGFSVYLGEALLGAFAIFLFSFITLRFKRFASFLLVLMIAVMLAGIAVFAVGVFTADIEPVEKISPLFSDNVSVPEQIWMCLAFVPWAFVGFETLSNSSAEFSFSGKKSFAVMALAVVVIALCYIMVIILSVLSIPEGFANWSEYLVHLKSEKQSVPIMIFSGAERFLGSWGLPVLALTVLGALVTSIITNVTASSRLLYALGRDDILPRWFTILSSDHVPTRAIWFVIICSVGMPFLGRTVISWTVDMTTIGAVFAYAYTSAAAVKLAIAERDTPVKVTGILGIVISFLFMLFLLIPHIFTENTLESESYLMLAFWSIIGFFFFRVVFKKDHRFGNSSVVGIALLSLIFFALLMWVRQASFASVKESVNNISEYYMNIVSVQDPQIRENILNGSSTYIGEQLSAVKQALHENSLIQFFSMVLGLSIMFSVYSIIRRREIQLKQDKINAEMSSKAKGTFLSNMSHDIRTPMNAIIGYTDIALQPGVSADDMRDYLRKISSSSIHLMDLVNDVLEMSRIENGKLELKLASNDIVKIIEDIHDMFSNQMLKKNIDFVVDTSNVEQRQVICDAHYLKRIVMNLVGNALKFTSEGGKVEMFLIQKREEHSSEHADVGLDAFDNVAVDKKPQLRSEYVFVIRDNGIGMSAEFAEKVFEPFERERTSTVSGISGTGLGMAISKTLVDLMKGTITCKTAQGRGTEFTVTLPLEYASDEQAASEDKEPMHANGVFPVTPNADMFKGKRVLLVEDIAINREIATMSLNRFGFEVETAENGRQAVDKLSSSAPGYFDIVLMDIQMPVMDGHAAARMIRQFENKSLASIPIVAMTANAFVEDIEAEKNSGMDGHISKPLNIDEMVSTLAGLLKV
jgi:signal transduction histidine kinase/CheY-like chemotaxis protein